MSLVEQAKLGKDVPGLWDDVRQIAYKIARHFGKKHHDAEDVAQEVCLKFFRKIKLFDENKSSEIGPYIGTITFNTIRDMWRRRQPVLCDNDLSYDLIYDKVDQGLEQMTKKDDQKKVKKILGAIDDTSAGIIEDYYFRGMTYPQIATEKGVPVGTVKSRLYAAKKRFKEISQLLYSKE